MPFTADLTKRTVLYHIPGVDRVAENVAHAAVCPSISGAYVGIVIGHFVHLFVKRGTGNLLLI